MIISASVAITKKLGEQKIRSPSVAVTRKLGEQEIPFVAVARRLAMVILTARSREERSVNIVNKFITNHLQALL